MSAISVSFARWFVCFSFLAHFAKKTAPTTVTPTMIAVTIKMKGSRSLSVTP